MASLLDEVLGQSGWDTTPLLQPPDERPPSLQPDPRVDALGQTFQAIVDYEKRKHQEGVDAGNWEGGWPWEGGHPTWKAAKGGIDQYKDALLLGSTSSGGKGFSLEQVPLRRQYLQPNTHTWKIKDPAGDPAGVIDTTFAPETGLLRIDDIQSEGGKNTLGPGAIRELRASLLERYPNATALSGQRITGAVSADRPSGAGPGRAATQIIQRAPEPEPPSFNVYHGSPHLFEPTPKNPLGEFRDKAIGTGEGAQAYGYGHYLAENEGVARNYRDALTPQTIPNPEFHALHTEYNVADAAAREAIMTGTEAQYQASVAARDAVRAKLATVRAVIPNPAGPRGHMYEVKVNADPEKFLHWDKPLSEQHPDVQAALAKLPPPDDNLMFPITPKSLGRDYVSGYGSQALKDVGLPGIRYRDAGSRDAKGEPTHNAVVFDPATMEIIRRYGLAGLMLGGGGLLSPNKQEQ
jgi:hypothetical protein